MNALFEVTTPADKLERFIQLVEDYRDARKEHADFVALESTAATAEADAAHADLLILKMDEVGRHVTACSLIMLADGLFDRCAEILTIETAGRI
tara:strand:- start:1231 stop:1512 length:282 start_codon:yes stop_codon:yes gene_type:complete